MTDPTNSAVKRKPVSAYSADLEQLQDALTSNLERLGISTDGQHLGNLKTGKSDGLLGERTSRALEKLVLLAQIDAGVKPEAAKSEFTQENLTHIETYLKKHGVEPSDISKITSNLAAVNAPRGEGKPSLLAAHFTTGQVDVKTLKVPEVKPATATSPSPAPTTLTNTFAGNAGPANTATTESPQAQATTTPPAPPKGRTIEMSFDEYERIKKKIDSGKLVSVEDRAAANAFEKAYAQLKDSNGYNKVKKEYDEALDMQRHPGKFREQMKAELATLEHKVQDKIDLFENKKMTVTVEIDGKKQTFENVSKAELDAEYGMRWNDGDVARAVRKAVDAEIEKLKDADPTFRKDEAAAKALDTRIDNYYTDVQARVTDLGSTVRRLERDMEHDPIKVFVPDPAPKPSPAVTTPAPIMTAPATAA